MPPHTKRYDAARCRLNTKTTDLNMNARHLLPIAALALPLCMQAKPAYPGVLTHVNPDGTTVQIRLHGDEHFSFITDTEGMLMKRDASGAMVYDLVNGQRLMASPEIIANMKAAAAATDIDGINRAPSRMAALDSEGRTVYPTKGETRSLVILLEYSDVKFQPNSAKDIDDMLNSEGYTKYGCNGSVRDYYIYNSNGQYKPIFDVSRVVTLPYTSKYYTGGDKYTNFKEAIKYALDELDDEINFSQYDYDNDGIVDTIYFYYAGYGQADTPTDGQTIWPHQSNLGAYGWRYDNVQIGPYACSNELNGMNHYYNQDMYLDGPGTFVHEFGHVLGMPDLYDPTYSGITITPGDWDIMDNGSYNNDGYCPPNLSAYEKWMYKWIEYTAVEDNKHYDLKTVQQGGEALRVPVVRVNGSPMTSEYFVIETRDKKNWDAYLADEGMLIWHLNYSNYSWSRNAVNTEAGRPRLSLVAADGTANWKLDGTGSPRKAAFPGSNVDNCYITPDTKVTFDCFNNNLLANPLDVYITSISYDAETGVSSFDYNVVREAPALPITMKKPTRTSNASGNPTSGFVLEWDPVEGAESYLLTVYRYSSSGKQIFESGYDEKNVGNTVRCEFKNLTSTKMGLEYHAYVRAFKGLPSSEKSNEVVFVPKEITETSGVESILTGDAENAPIYGVQGAVVAPQGAEIYNLSGVRVANENLAAGIYIVRIGNRVEKVAVR